MPTRTCQQPTKIDAAFGRGGKLNRIRAESFFRRTIEALWEEYCDIPNAQYAAKRDYIKMHIIVPIMQQKGRFLYNYNQEWFELHPKDENDCMEIVKRVQQALRDEKKRRSPSKDLTVFLHEVQTKKKDSKKDKDCAAATTTKMNTPTACPSLVQLASSITKMPPLTTSSSKKKNMPSCSRANKDNIRAVLTQSLHEISDNDSDCEPSPLWEMAAKATACTSLDSLFYNYSSTSEENSCTADLIREFEAEWGLDNPNDLWFGGACNKNVPPADDTKTHLVVSAQADLEKHYEVHDWSSMALPKDQLEGAFERRASITCVGPDVFWESEQQRRASMLSCVGSEIFFV